MELTKKQLKNTLFCYDLETTGINTSFCEITERYFEEYNLGFSPSNGLLKINGTIPDEVVNLTSITTNMCKERGEDISVFRNEIKDILKYCYKPNFIAHNGSSFDHIILKINDIFNSDIPKIQLKDSKYIIRMLNKEDTIKMKLEIIYKNIIKSDTPYKSHRAEADVKMMIDILKKLNYNFNL